MVIVRRNVMAVLVVGLLIALLLGASAAESGPLAKDVRVVNTPSEPVPVHGTLALATADREPFQANLSTCMQNTGRSIAVPADKSLNITSFAGIGNFSEFILITTVGGATAHHYFLGEGHHSSSSYVGVQRQAVDIHADPGTTVIVNPGSAYNNCWTATITGYLE